MNEHLAGKSEAYREAGVDIDLATSLLAKVKQKISSTRRPEALAPIGGFGGLFRIDLIGCYLVRVFTSRQGECSEPHIFICIRHCLS